MPDSPPPVTARFFRGCLLILAGTTALWLAVELLAGFWGWLLLLVGVVVVLCVGVAAYRYWWGRRS